MRRLALVCSAFALVGCASTQTGGGASGTVPDRVVISNPSGGAAMTTEVHGSASMFVDSLPISLTEAWARLPGVFEGLGLRVTRTDPASHTIEGELVRSRRPFGGKSFAALLDCGDIAGVPIASRADITMSVAATLEARGEQATLGTDVRAVANAMSTGASQTRCIANGGIGDMLAARLVAAAGAR